MHHPTLRRPRCLLIALLIAFLSASEVFAETTPDTGRLVATGKLWVTVRYFHPYLAYRNTDWDRAFCDALPAIRQAKSPEEYAAALNRMLDALHDPATRAFVAATATQHPEGLHFETRTDGGLIVSAAREGTQVPNRTPVETLVAALEHASTIVFDLRGSNFLSRVIDDPAVQSELSASEMDLPGQRTWVHNGLPPFRPTGSNVYYSAFLVSAKSEDARPESGRGTLISLRGVPDAAPVLRGSHEKPGERVPAHSPMPERHISFLLGENSKLPAIGAALWIAGKAAVLSDSSHALVDNPETISIPMGSGVEAVVRLSEAVTPAGRGLPELTADSSGKALDDAIEAAQHPHAPSPGPLLPPFPVESADNAYADRPYPSEELRILAAAKIWGAFHYFFAYKDLMDEDWDQDFIDLLPHFVAAKNTRDYNLAVSEMLVRVDDSLATVESGDLTNFFGEAPPPIRLRLIEKKPVVTRVLPEAKASGIVVGDVVTSVDHNSTVERTNMEAKYVSASTRTWLGDRIMHTLLNGKEGSIATLTVSSAGGQQKEVQLKRSKAYAAELETERDGDAVRLLAGGIGYADLNRLSRDDVDAMLDKLHNAKTIIFDMRGRAASGALEMAARLAPEEGMAGALVNGPLDLLPDLPTREHLTRTSSYFMVETLPKSGKTAYRGKTVMLIDERTAGEGERAGLFFESANKTIFIGSPSAGAISEVSNFAVPGGIVITLSGRDYRHSNGGQIQRLGIQPAVTVTPTLDGIRQGKDEVLDTAIQYASEQ